MLHLGSVYLIVRDFEKSISFYSALLQIPVTSRNMDRFAQFEFDGKNISIMNGYFDALHPELVVHKGEHDEALDDMVAIAQAENSRKMVLNFWTENLAEEYQRIAELGIGQRLTKIRYVCNVAPYYYFHLCDPDGNVIEITGGYDGEVE